MVKHMIIWKFKDELENKEAVAIKIKGSLEGLVGKIDGLLSMNIIIKSLPSSSGDIMMDSSFESKEALDFYQEHPLHKAIAGGIVRPAVSVRLSYDYEA